MSPSLTSSPTFFDQDVMMQLSTLWPCLGMMTAVAIDSSRKIIVSCVLFFFPHDQADIRLDAGFVQFRRRPGVGDEYVRFGE